MVTDVFQWGWPADLIGVHGTIYEEWRGGRGNTAAVVHGLAATGRTITAAAAVMVIIFAAFILGGDPTIKLFGVGLASAVLMDALIVRSVLIPGLMLALGETNWKLPSSLERLLPRLKLEGGGHRVPSASTPPMESETPA